MKRGEAPRGYRIGTPTSVRGGAVARLRDIAAGLGPKATPEEARKIARVLVRRLNTDAEGEPEEGQS